MHCATTPRLTYSPSCRISPFSTAISSVLSAVLASPFANRAIAARSASPICTRWLPNPSGQFSARERSFTISDSSSALSTKTLHLERSAELISKDGFSVVAPTRIILPFSTKGRNASCCALLNR